MTFLVDARSAAASTEDKGLYNDGKDYEDGGESYYEDGEVGVDFEEASDSEENYLDWFRKNKGAFAAVGAGASAGGEHDVTNNASAVATAPTSVNSLVNGQPAHVFSEDKKSTVRSVIEEENLLKQEAEAKAARLLHAEQIERERLAAMAAKEAEENKAREARARVQAEEEAAAKREELERLEKERIDRERILEEETCRAMQADLAEAERLGKEKLEKKGIIEGERILEEQRQKEEVEARRR